MKLSLLFGLLSFVARPVSSHSDLAIALVVGSGCMITCFVLIFMYRLILFYINTLLIRELFNCVYFRFLVYIYLLISVVFRRSQLC